MIEKRLCSFLSIYVAYQTRDGNLAKFFTYGNQAASPSLSGTSKADLLQCLALEEKQSVNVDAKLYDGVVVVQMLN